MGDAPLRYPQRALIVPNPAKYSDLASRVGEFLAGADFGGEEGVDGKVSES